ncbi:MAG: substrate-binding domain-containing protein [Zetaproteobacteria bacterium]|nr:substrate-binding domain-containing protein [Zetaproteobacteria bacterium]
MNRKLIAIASVATICASAGVAQARDQINIVGSSTVYPFASYVAEELGATTHFKTPVIESTGSGGGMKLFCEGDGLDTPDITNASRRMKDKELTLCESNGVKSITEVVIGFDGIVIAQNNKNGAINLTRNELLMAVAAEVPSKDGKSLVANPYQYWDQINASLPHRKIVFYGPPTSSGTRDAFEDLVMKHLTKHMDVYTALYHADKEKNKKYKKYKTIRTDGVYVPAGENDNLIVQKLLKDESAFGIFGYSFYEENIERLSAANVEGVSPQPSAISSGEYPVSRSLYFYIKNSHINQIKGMTDYVNLFLNEKMIGEGGNLSDIGLIPLPKAERDASRARFANHTQVTMDDLKSKK